MKGRIATATVVLATALLGPAAHAQMGFRAPDMHGVWNPVVGAGAVYQIERGGDRKSEMEIAVVGKETVDDKTGYWLEISAVDPRSGGPVYMKHLMVRDGDLTEIKRRIMQVAGRPPIEMPMMSPRGPRAEPPSSADVRKGAERVGTESVTTPAGTFSCEHYRTKDGATDVWVSDKVAPWGLVKMTGRDATTTTLLRVVADATTKITGTPQKFDPAEMMRRRPGRE